MRFNDRLYLNSKGYSTEIQNKAAFVVFKSKPGWRGVVRKWVYYSEDWVFGNNELANLFPEKDIMFYCAVWGEVYDYMRGVHEKGIDTIQKLARRVACRAQNKAKLRYES